MSVWEDTDKVLAALAGATSIREVLQRLGVQPTSAQYRNARNFAADNSVELPVNVPDSSRIEKAHKATKKLSLEEVLVQRSTASRKVVKRLLISHDLAEYICARCRLNPYSEGIYQGAVLQLEHKNGVGDDNRIENLEFLCPTCHTMTPTFSSRNKVRYENGTLGVCNSCGRKSKQALCGICSPPRKQLYDYSPTTLAKLVEEFGIDETAKKLDVTKTYLRVYIRQVLTKTAKVFEIHDINLAKKSVVAQKVHRYPSLEEVIQLVESFGYVEAGRRIGVSDNAVRKYLKRRVNTLPHKTKR